MVEILRGARPFADPDRGPIDLVVDDSQIVEVTRAGKASGGVVVDLDGLELMPGSIDAHVHPIHDETFASVGSAAVYGGVTTICNQLYPATGESSSEAIKRMSREGELGAADFAAHVRWDRSRRYEDVVGAADAGAISIKVFLAHPDKQMQSSLGDLTTAMSYAKQAGLLTLVHAELGDVVDELLRVGIGKQDTVQHMNDWRSTAIEGAAVRAAGVIAGAVGAPLYVVHTSCENSMREATAARGAGVELYVETCPHYLFLDENSAPPGGQGFVLPPLRSHTDREFMRRMTVAGFVDTIGSDHCGHGPASKPVDKLAGAKAGLPGVEAMVPLVIDAALGDDPWLSRSRVEEVLSSNAARVFGLSRKGSLKVGCDADIVAIDPSGSNVLHAVDLHDAAGYSPYEGTKLRGRLNSVWRRGELVIDNGAASGSGGGQYVRGGGRLRSRGNQPN
ncbi:MAG: amidohydrolase family protein [Terrimesophilobacter sp.]